MNQTRSTRNRKVGNSSAKRLRIAMAATPQEAKNNPISTWPIAKAVTTITSIDMGL